MSPVDPGVEARVTGWALSPAGRRAFRTDGTSPDLRVGGEDRDKRGSPDAGRAHQGGAARLSVQLRGLKRTMAEPQPTPWSQTFWMPGMSGAMSFWKTIS